MRCNPLLLSPWQNWTQTPVYVDLLTQIPYGTQFKLYEHRDMFSSSPPAKTQVDVGRREKIKYHHPTLFPWICSPG